MDEFRPEDTFRLHISAKIDWLQPIYLNVFLKKKGFDTLILHVGVGFRIGTNRRVQRVAATDTLEAASAEHGGDEGPDAYHEELEGNS